MAIKRNIKEHLHGLMGQRVTHQGIPCVIVEVLENEPAIVLQAHTGHSGLQDTQYGNPGRRVPETFTIPLYEDDEEGAYHPDLRQLGLLTGC